MSRETWVYRCSWLLIGAALATACAFCGAALVATYSRPLVAAPPVRQATEDLLKPAPVVVDVAPDESDSGQVCPVRQAHRITIRAHRITMETDTGRIASIHC